MRAIIASTCGMRTRSIRRGSMTISFAPSRSRFFMREANTGCASVGLAPRTPLSVSGHWEGDLIICKRTRPVLVLHERKSRVTLAARLAGKTAAETISVMLAVFARSALWLQD